MLIQLVHPPSVKDEPFLNLDFNRVQNKIIKFFSIVNVKNTLHCISVIIDSVDI
jgi:hypothetical protein